MNMRIRFPFLALPATLALMGTSSLADDTEPKKETKETESVKEKKGAGDKVEPSVLDKLKKELFKELEEDPAGGAEAEKKENKLERAAKGMRNAGEKLDGQQTGDPTRKVQEQVIRDLDDLIKHLENPPPPPPQGGGGGGAMSQLQKMKQQQNQGQSGKQQQGQPQSSQGGTAKKSGGRDKEQASGSEERTDAERKAAEEAARKKKLEMDVWGHLPPHLRDQLLNTYGERMLPKYQQLVKQFYEALSEQKDPRR